MRNDLQFLYEGTEAEAADLIRDVVKELKNTEE